MPIPADTAAERAIWFALSQSMAAGKSSILADLLKAGLRREWFSNSILSRAIEGAVRLHLRGDSVDLLTLMSHCSDIGRNGWDNLSAAWIEGRELDPINWRLFVPSLKEYALLREVDGVLLDMKEQRRQEPRGVKSWLPYYLQRLRDAIQNGEDYDPTPSAIWDAGVPTKVIASTGLRVFDKALGGGLRNGMLVLCVAPTGMGKSRLTYTLAANSVAQKHRVIVISTEARPFDVVAGVLQAFGGFTDYEIENKRGRDEGRHELLNDAVASMDKHLYVWGRNKGTRDGIEELLYWVKPTHLLLDHLLPMANRSRRQKGEQRHAIEDFADYLEMASVKHQCTITIFSQLSGLNADRLKKKHDLPSASAFGSALPEQCASVGILMMRHWAMMNTLYARVKKQRIDGALLDLEFTLRHDPQSHSFYEEVPSGHYVPGDD